MIVISDRFGEVLGAIDSAKASALERAGMMMVSHARAYVPVETGRLRDSLSYGVSGDMLTVGTSVDYAPYVELGVRERAGAHFLRNAVSMHTHEYAAAISEVFGGKVGMKGGDENGNMENETQG